jgi:hypothetical protein
MWLVIKNPHAFSVDKDSLYDFGDQVRLSNINTLRGQLPISRFFVNKFTWNAKEIFSRVAETYDLHYLVLEGDIDKHRSTGKAGPILFTMLPIIIIGLTKRWLWILGGLSIIAGLVQPHFFTPSRIPLFLVFNLLAAKTIASGKVHNWYWGLVILELVRFIHDFFLHYPTRLNT